MSEEPATTPTPGEVNPPPLEAGTPGGTQRILDHHAAADASQAETGNVRRTVTEAIELASGRGEDLRDSATDRLVERLTALETATGAAEHRRDEVAAALLAAIDERLEKVLAGTARTVEAADASRRAELDALLGSLTDTVDLRGRDTDRLVERLTALETATGAAEHRRDEVAAALLAAIDERLEKVLAGTARTVEAADASRRAELDALLGSLTDAIDALAHAEGRIDALAGAHVGEARAVEDRVARLLTEVGERAEAAVDRSRAHIAEGQLALGARFGQMAADLLTAIQAATGDHATTLATSIDQLRVASNQQSAALLDAVHRSREQTGEVERSSLDALLLEVVAGRHDQLRAVEAVAARIDEVGPLVARALLAEVERAARAASAAEDAAVGATELTAERFARLEAAIGDRTGGAEAPAIEEAWREIRTLHASVCATIQEGARAAEVTANDVRSLRDRITPHLVALGEATARRVEADQAGFDAVLARMDQLFPTRQPGRPEPAIGDRSG